MTGPHVVSTRTLPVDPLVQRVEEASLNAWPALTQLLYDGWIVRMTHGFTRRANSVTPLGSGGARPLLDKIRWCENFYARSRQPTLFRLPLRDDLSALRTALRARGYTEEEPTRVLVAPLRSPAAPLRSAAAASSSVRFTHRKPWLSAYAELTGEPEAARPMHDLILRGIAGDSLHALIEDGERPVACALGVVEDDLLGLFDVATSEADRRRGHASALLTALHARGVALGARRAYLQVVTDNAPAAALYETFGYMELYRYIYLRAPG